MDDALGDLSVRIGSKNLAFVINDELEACVERIFVDVLERCRPRALSVYARFMRRGGIDINPFRSNFESRTPDAVRTPRQ